MENTSLHCVKRRQSNENHVGYILSGIMMIKDASGIETEVGPAEAFEVDSVTMRSVGCR